MRMASPRATLENGAGREPCQPRRGVRLGGVDTYALYRSDDGGASFRVQSKDSNIGNRPFYYAEIHASPTNEDHVFSLWTWSPSRRMAGRRGT